MSWMIFCSKDPAGHHGLQGNETMDIIKQLAAELGIREAQAQAAVSLIDEGNTIPFIARYRKEATGSLDDARLRSLGERLSYLRNLEERKNAVLKSIEEQGKLTEELKSAVLAASQLSAVEDLYRPYRPKRRTRAMAAAEKGLMPLAEAIRGQEIPEGMGLKAFAGSFVKTDAGKPELCVNSAEEALQGALDILAEEISDDAGYRSAIRKVCREQGIVRSELKNEEARTLDEKGTFEAYYGFSGKISGLPGHRILALNRGEKTGVLSVRMEFPEEIILSALVRDLVKKDEPETAAALKSAAADGLRRLLLPSIERELRAELFEHAESGAIELFGKNLKQLLLQPPIEGQVVLGWDPAFRTGCKLAVTDATGKVLDTAVIYPTPPHNRTEEAKTVLRRLIKKYGVTLISLGNGTASRESEQFICELLKEPELSGVKYVIVNEAGASVYSASELATEEFPEFDVGQRSAASMARRLQDPLAELVKIDPKSIGVGQYQHDMDQKKLSESLGAVVESCVNAVGVDLNTASASLLSYVSGINAALAKSIVAYREQNGRFADRRQLLKVPRLGPKAFEQCAGFLRIRGGREPLDVTAVHPESYAAAGKLMELLGVRPSELGTGAVKTCIAERFSGKGSRREALSLLAGELGIGVPTLTDILSELEKPGRDPREELPKPILKSNVLSMEDLKEGMILKGTVRNIMDFGAFVDIGVHQDGLVHISQMSGRYLKSPLEAVSVGDVVDVKVLSVDLKKQRIALSMRI